VVVAVVAAAAVVELIACLGRAAGCSLGGELQRQPHPRRGRGRPSTCSAQQWSRMHQ
jgi:hypothetical protein